MENGDGGGVHEGEGTWVIGFCEGVEGGEAVERTAIDADDYVSVWEEVGGV